MIVSHSRRFVYIHVHRTAGESITAALRPRLDRRDLVVSGDLQTWLRRKAYRHYAVVGGLRKHSTARAVRQRLPAELWRAYYTFGFVRHPMDRALSYYGYLARIAARRERPRLRHAWYLTPAGRDDDPSNWPALRAYLDTDSFSAFIRHPLLDNAAGMRPQVAALCDRRGRVIVDFVGRFERLVDDFDVVQRAVGLPHCVLPWRNASRDVGQLVADLSIADREYLAARFAEDFERFGYEP